MQFTSFCKELIICECTIRDVAFLYKREIFKHNINIFISFLFGLIKNINDKAERRDLEIWLETEFLKQRMTTRQNYLIKKEEMIKSSDVGSSCPNFMNENEKEMFFKTIHEHQNHLVSIFF